MAKLALGANYSCPKCDRPTLEETANELVAYKCAVCGERLTEAP